MIKILIHFFLFVAIGCLAACQHNQPALSPKNITLMFSSIKSNYDTLHFRQGPSLAVRQPLLTVNLSYLNTIYPAMEDTISIEPEVDYIVLTHRFAPLSEFCYLLESGDSVRVDYAEGVPFATVLNRNMKPYDLNYDYLRCKRYALTDGLRTEDILKQPAIGLILEPGKYASIVQARQAYALRWETELNDESRWLDSLRGAELISASSYRLYKERNRYQKALQALTGLPADSLLAALASYNDTIYRQDVAGFYRNYYNALGSQYMNAHYPRLAISHGMQRKAYDELEGNQLVHGALGESLRKLLLPYLLRLASFKERSELVSHFKATAYDSIFANEVRQKYVTSVCRETALPLADSLRLVGVDGSHTTLGSLLRQWENRPVYVDFWSSSCGPCLQAMPQSEALRNDGTWEGIVFLYLSMDSKDAAWKGALRKARLEQYPYSYRVDERESAGFLTHYAVDWLPRYMLFDREKNVFDSDAPGPGQAELKKLFQVVK